MKSLKVLIPLSILSLAYNFAILISVTLNLHWVRTRAAGGQFKDFPISIRIMYLIMAFIMIFLIGMIWNHRENPMNAKGPIITRVLGYVFILSSLTQLISRSTNERWNAIPAFVIAFTFLGLSKREKTRLGLEVK
jgi:L-asparagine transporter-like permease